MLRTASPATSYRPLVLACCGRSTNAIGSSPFSLMKMTPAASRAPSAFRRRLSNCGAWFESGTGIEGTAADQSSGPGACDEADLLNGLGARERFIAWLVTAI